MPRGSAQGYRRFIGSRFQRGVEYFAEHAFASGMIHHGVLPRKVRRKARLSRADRRPYFGADGEPMQSVKVLSNIPEKGGLNPIRIAVPL